jgi:hypothetical protein
MGIGRMMRMAALGLMMAWVIGMGAAGAEAWAAAPAREVWQGEYDCAQGVTGLTLTLDIGRGGQVQGLFDFYPVVENPAVPRGCFQMSGSLDGTGHLALVPGEWLLRPPFYVAVGLAGVLSGGSLGGTIEGPGCSVFLLHRAPPQARQGKPSACVGVVS